MLYECKNLTFKTYLISKSALSHCQWTRAYHFLQAELVGGLNGLGMTGLLPVNCKGTEENAACSGNPLLLFHLFV